MRKLAGARKRYGKRIWITEFAVLGKPWAGIPQATRAQEDAYMQEVLPLLDASDDVFRCMRPRLQPATCARASRSPTPRARVAPRRPTINVLGIRTLNHAGQTRGSPAATSQTR